MRPWDEPFQRFHEWFQAAKAAGHFLPEAFCLSTTSKEGSPSGRFLLLKGVEKSSFVFFTNYESRKSHELDTTQRAAMTFYWEALHKQIRIEGRVERVSESASDAYWKTRPRESQIGGWASPQSSVISSRDALDKSVQELTEKFKGKDVPRPPHWGGYALMPSMIEFWTGQVARLHDREVYEAQKNQKGWNYSILAP